MLRSDTAGYQQALAVLRTRDERFGVIEFAVGVDVTAEFRRAVSEVPQEEWQVPSEGARSYTTASCPTEAGIRSLRLAGELGSSRDSTACSSTLPGASSMVGDGLQPELCDEATGIGWGVGKQASHSPRSSAPGPIQALRVFSPRAPEDTLALATEPYLASTSWP